MRRLPPLFQFEDGLTLNHAVFVASIVVLIFACWLRWVSPDTQPVINVTAAYGLLGLFHSTMRTATEDRKTLLAWLVPFPVASAFTRSTYPMASTEPFALFMQATLLFTLFAAFVLSLGLLPNWLAERYRRGGVPFMESLSPEERNLTEQERRDGGFDEDELQRIFEEFPPVQSRSAPRERLLSDTTESDKNQDRQQ